MAFWKLRIFPNNQPRDGCGEVRLDSVQNRDCPAWPAEGLTQCQEASEVAVELQLLHVILLVAVTCQCRVTVHCCPSIKALTPRPGQNQ